MRKILQLSFALASFQAISQPVITDASNVPAVGYSAPLSTAPCLSAGSAGASQTWDFSSLSFSSLGTLSVINPATSAFGSSFPSANWCYSVSGVAYSYFQNTPTEMINWASLITATGGSDDYSANPKTIMHYPWNFNDTFTDSYTESSSTSNVTVTYDGYGTLIMPSGNTYTNVVRVKESYGSTDDYRWYITSPLLSVAVFSASDNLLYWVGATPTGITENNPSSLLAIFPNPADETVQLNFNSQSSSTTVSITALDGKVVYKENKTTTVGANTITLDISTLPAGIYTVQAGSSFQKLSVN
ncbi:MAG TPA: T9SS type A sorting domain-containing protein [Flavobacteriales bacterium]|nr:T9SS type A sorting domain-containing protein [Flavobacteriales bacterium]